MTQDNTLGAVPNVPGAVYRQTLNNAIQSICTYHAGLTEPPIVYPFMQWWDLNGYVLKMRDPSNTAWVPLGSWAENKWWPVAGGENNFGLGAYVKWNVTTVDPVSTDDWISGGYWVGSAWINVINQSAYICVNNSQNAAVWKQISGVPAGTIAMWGGYTAPDGWFPCDGRAISRTLYINLFNAIGGTWGAGDGWTTFNIPPLNLQFVRGWHPSAFPVGSWWPQDMLYHTHSVVDYTHSHLAHAAPVWHHRVANSGYPDFEPVDFWLQLSDEGGRGMPFRWAPSYTQAQWVSAQPANIAIQPVGGSENRPAAVSVMYIIKH